MSSTALKRASRFSRDDLHPYQERAVSFVKDNPSCALWVDMGLGKTVVVLTAIVELVDLFEVGRVLVVSTLRVANTTWPIEIGLWDHVKSLSFAVATGSRRKRLAAVNSGATVVMINRENFAWLTSQFKREDWPFDCIVWDESSSLKNHGAKRSRAAHRLARPLLRWKFEQLPNGKRRKVYRPPLPPVVDRFIELTGTPATNGLMDVWSQIAILDDGKRLGRTITQYRERYFDHDPYQMTWTLKDGAEEKIHAKLKDICLTLAAKDYIQLPQRVDNLVEIPLPNRVRRQYEELEKEFLLEIGDETVEVLHAAALSNKLLQFANGAIYTGDDKSWVAVHDAKLDALAEIVDEAAGQPMLVAYNYQSDAARISKRFPQAEMIGRDPETINRWNRGEIPMLLAHPASAGHGLNLQHGGNTIVWFGLNWSLELYQQLNARLHRQGQTKPVIVHHLVARGTVDHAVMATLDRKDTTQRALLNALKKDIEGRIGE